MLCVCVRVCARHVCTHHDAHAQVREQLVGVGFLLPPSGFQGSSSGCESWAFSLAWKINTVLNMYSAQSSAQVTRWKLCLPCLWTAGIFIWLSVLMGGATLLLKVFLMSRAQVSGNVLHLWVAPTDLPSISPVRCYAHCRDYSFCSKYTPGKWDMWKRRSQRNESALMSVQVNKESCDGLGVSTTWWKVGFKFWVT